MEEKFFVPPKEKQSRLVSVTVSLKKETNDKLKQIAEETNRSRSEVAYMAVCYALDHIEHMKKGLNEQRKEQQV